MKRNIFQSKKFKKKSNMTLDELTSLKKKQNIASKNNQPSLNEEQKKIVKIKALKTKNDNTKSFTEEDIKLKMKQLRNIKLILNQDYNRSFKKKSFFPEK